MSYLPANQQKVLYGWTRIFFFSCLGWRNLINSTTDVVNLHFSLMDCTSVQYHFSGSSCQVAERQPLGSPERWSPIIERRRVRTVVTVFGFTPTMPIAQAGTVQELLFF